MIGRPTAFFLLVFVVDLLSGQELVLKPSKDVFLAPVGSSMVISCSISQVDEGTNNSYGLHWIDHNHLEVTTTNGRVYIEDDGPDLKKLYVTSIRESDAGLYNCRSRIDNAWQKRAIRLTVFKDITFDDAPFVQNPSINTDALILCKVSGIPAPQVHWRHKDARIHYGEKFIKEEDGLRIKGITEADNGIYTCRAEIEIDGRYDERRIEVVVNIPPKITHGLSANVGVQGTDLAMSCQASGLPSPLYEFFKDSQSEPIASSDRIHVENFTGNIYFSPLVKLDEGQYTCRASNGAGNDTTVGELKVLVPPSVETLDVVLVSEGETATIECRSHGDPVPDMTFQWANYDSAQKDNNRTEVSKPEDGVLVASISDVELSDAGNFSCQALSSVGTDERIGTLKVLFKPRFFDNQTSVVYVFAGKKQNMTCGISAVPDPTIEWFRGGIPLANNDTYHIYSVDGISLLQVQVRDVDQGWIYGSYVCRATNSLGEVEKSINLYRASIPDTPQLVELVEAYPTSISLRVVAPEEDGGMSVNGYRVEYEDGVKDFSLSDDIAIDDLKPSTAYSFKVRAKNEVGIGLGVEIKVSTSAIRPPYPIEITSKPEGEDAYGYIITWKDPINGGLPILSYLFSYRKVSVEKSSFNISQPLEDWMVEKTDDIPLNFFQLEALQPESYYELEIKTQNGIGTSQPNKQFVFLTAKGTDAEGSVGSRTADVTVPVVVVVVCIFFLAIVDISCYFMNRCGLTMFICVHVCGREPKKFRSKGIETGESDKKPLSEDARQQMEPLATSHSGDSDCKEALVQSHRSEEQTNGEPPDIRVRLKNVPETDGTGC